jgi:hypothetical protein
MPRMSFVTISDDIDERRIPGIVIISSVLTGVLKGVE